MKKILLILVALSLTFSTKMTGQIINPGFETWTNDILVPTAMNPNSGNGTTGWWDFNYFNSPYFGSSPVSVTRCSDTVHTGNYSARVETKVYTQTSWNIYNSWGIPFIGHPYNDTLGILFDGNVNTTNVTFKPGIPCTQNLAQFKFYYQYKPSGNDTAECRVELVRSGTPVAGGSFKTGTATGGSGWQQAVIDFTYINGLTPDTLWILFSSSSLDYKAHNGSVLWIDDVSVSLGTGIELPLEDLSNFEVFPNPSNGIFTINNDNSKYQTIEIFNLRGEKIYSATGKGNTAPHVDISGSPNGIYFMKVQTNVDVTVKKIIKE